MPSILSEFGTVVGVSNVDVQVTSLPSDSYPEGKIVQYVGPTTQDYTNGFYYKKTQTGWEQIDVQPNSSESITYDNSASGSTATTVQEALDELAAHVNGVTFRLVD